MEFVGYLIGAWGIVYDAGAAYLALDDDRMQQAKRKYL